LLATLSSFIVSGKLIQHGMMSDASTQPGGAEAPLLSYTVGRLDRAIRQRLREILAPYKLSVPQFTTLSVIKRRPGLSNAQLARRALILPQSMIQVIAELETRGLVTRTPAVAHNRVLEAVLTAQGRELVDSAERDTRAFEAELARIAGGQHNLELTTTALQRWLDHLHERR
jgi:DNA-binding MarR family transcriptional regulator